MALIIEDGSIVTGANSYVTVEEIRAYSESRGLDLPTADADVEKMAVQSFDYIEALGPKFKGRKATKNQRTQWPRMGVVIDCEESPPDSIPWQLKEAQCQATYEAVGGDLIPNPETSAVKREKVDVLETEYQDGAPAEGGISYLPKVNAKLTDLLATTGGRIRVSRG